jgi:hypothetical protein
MTSIRTFLFVTPFLALVACGNTTAATDAGGHSVSSPTCNEILERCHPLDTGTGEIHECHEMSEENVEADCVAMRDHCFMVCTPADAGDVDAGN